MRYGGLIGFGITEETRPGIWKPETIVERMYYGDVLKPRRQIASGSGINDNVTVSNQISIIADGFANEHFLDIRYIVWKGYKWKVNNVDPDTERPRLTLDFNEIWKEESEEEEEEEEEEYDDE